MFFFFLLRKLYSISKNRTILLYLLFFTAKVILFLLQIVLYFFLLIFLNLFIIVLFNIYFKYTFIQDIIYLSNKMYHVLTTNAQILDQCDFQRHLFTVNHQNNCSKYTFLYMKFI